MSFLEVFSLISVAIGSTLIIDLVRKLLEKTRERKPSVAVEILRKSLAERGIEEHTLANLLDSLADSKKNDRIAALVRLSGSIEMIATSLVELSDDSRYLAKRFLPITSVFDELHRRRVIDGRTLDAFREFLSVRNKIIHGRTATSKELDDALYLGIGVLVTLLAKTERERET